MLAGVLALAACHHRVPVSGVEGDGAPSSDGALLLDLGPDASAIAAAHIFVVDDTDHLRKYHPASNTFSSVGTLGCSSWGHPFSMAVDRGGRAWVLYNDGRIYWVDTTDASCQPSPFVQGQQGFNLFGMGFVADGAGVTTETLYIAGNAPSPGDRLGRIDAVTTTITSLGQLSVPPGSNSPELTGTRDGRLYAYFPGFSKSSVVLLDKVSLKTVKSWSVAPSKNPTAWAFAHWGGRFFIFITDGSNARVLRLDPASGKTTQLRSKLPFQIVGAGVSTRAPLTLPDPDAGP
jgi:hypothetical protein